jgi:CRP/FNR family cyclic AMP-dependent transcriptional regulator
LAGNILGKDDIQYRKDQIVFAQRRCCGRSSTSIQRGKVKLTVVSDQGKEAVVAILNHVSFRRRMSEWPSAAHRTTRAIDECVIARLEKATVIATIHNEPGLRV